MAIIITAKQIYDIISNDKIIDNPSNGIDTDEDKAEDLFGTISNSYTIKLYEWDNTNPSSTNLRDYLKFVGDENNNGQIEMDVTLTPNPNIPTGGQSAVFRDYISCTIKFRVDKKVKIGKIYSSNNVRLNFFNRDKENYTYEKSNTLSDETIQRYEFDYNGEDIYTVKIENKPIMSYIQEADVNGNLTISTGFFYQSITFFLEANYINIEEESISYGENPKFSVESNELLQVDTTINGKKLSQYIYEQITDEWGKGKETATLKCSIGEYYDENGALAISTKDTDLPMTFNIRDLVIPYIPTARGGTEPMSINLNGNPKIFQVTQVRPYFDGACWQEITLQEFNIDEITKEYALESGDVELPTGVGYLFGGTFDFNEGNVHSIVIKSYNHDIVNTIHAFSVGGNGVSFFGGTNEPNQSFNVTVLIRYYKKG